jgi:hypothetical protein
MTTSRTKHLFPFPTVAMPALILALLLPGPALAQQEPREPIRRDAWPPPQIVVEPERAPERTLDGLSPGSPVRLTAFQVALRTDEPLAVRLIRLVTRTDGDLHRVVGDLESVAGDTLTILTGLVHRPLSLPLADIDLIEARGGRYEWAGAKRGAEIGAFSGGLLFALLYRNGWAALLGSVVGAAPGAAIGAAVGAPDWEPVSRSW